jgi:uncharacterized iron-regulated protein
MMSFFKGMTVALFSCALVISVTGPSFAHPHIINASTKAEISPQELIHDLQKAQVIFIGEFHDHRGHHAAQLDVISALQNQDDRLAVGLEMFRRDSQHALDQWVENQLTESEFLPIYEDNWSMWPNYSAIFEFARDRGTKLIGLNISRDITAHVARNGFDSLPEDLRQRLGNVQCIVNPTYSSYIRKALGGHGGHGSKYLFFCEAQLLWDTMMARHIVDFINNNPDYRVVVLAGSAHSWKFGIPRQLLEQADVSYRVLLPEVFGRVDRLDVNEEIADYLWLDVGEDGWSL